MAIARALCETIEPRRLLTVTLRNAVPASIAPASAPQELLAPGVNSYSQASPFNTVVSSSFRFALNNAAPGQTTTFQTSSTATTDALIAIYDASGNRIALQDADPASAPGNEVLTTALQSGTPYTVAFFSRQQNAGSGTTTVAMTIDPGLQALGNSITVSPSTNSGSLNTSSAPNAFTSSTSVRYFPLDFLNAGGQGNVTIEPRGPDSAVAMSVFLQTGPTTWVKQSSQNFAIGQTANQSVSPPTGLNVTDGTYMLALAPLNFAAAPQPVNITASTFTPLTPAAVPPASAEALPIPTLGTTGVLTTTVNSGLIGASKLFSIVASVSGPLSLTYTPAATIAGRLSVYGPGGTTMLDVASRTTNGTPVPLTFNATAGTQYFIFAGADAGGFGIPITLTATQTISPTPVSVGPTLGQQANLALAPADGAKAFTFTPQPGGRFIAFHLAPDAGATLTTQFSLIGASGPVQTFTSGGAGQAQTIVVDTSTSPGPYQVLVRSIAGTGTATLRHATLALPATINPATLNTVALDLQTGGVASGSLATTTGQLAGIRYFQPHSGANPAPTVFTATSTGGTASILLHYVQDGSTFRLAGSAVPNAAGVASVSAVARSATEHAIVALPLNFSGSGTVQLAAAGPLPTGLGLALVPNAVPNSPPPPEGFRSTVSVNGGKLSTSLQRDLYGVQLPFNLVGTTSSLVFTPAQLGGPMRAVVSVLNSSNVVIATATSNAGQPVTIPISGLAAGQAIRFEVRQASGANLGTGEYRLSMSIGTTDPLPFLVIQPQFFPFTASQVPGRSYLPNNVPITPINFGTTGGSATGNFTSSTPYNNNGTGSIQVFAISGFTNNNPYQISTTPIDPGVNTNFAIFYFNTSTNSYQRVPGTAPSFDYFPGDRSTVDARIVVNNTAIAPSFDAGEFGGSRTIFVVVMNEGGSRGSYTVRAEPAPQPTAGPGNPTPSSIITPVPRAAGSATSLRTLESFQTSQFQSFIMTTPSDTATSGAISMAVRKIGTGGGTGVSVSITAGFTTVASGSATFSGNTATVALTGSLQPNTTYSVSVTINPFLSGQLGLLLSIPRVASPPGLVPPASVNSGTFVRDASFTAAISRLQPAPDGTLNQQLNSSGGSFFQMFSVHKDGVVDLTVHYAGSGSPAVGLYQAGKTQPGPPYNDVNILHDFDNTRDAQNRYRITGFFPNGTYYLRGLSFSDAAPITITGNVPAYQTQVLATQPSTGLTTQSEQTIINQGSFGSTTGVNDNGFSDRRHSSHFFRYTVPQNASGGPVTFTLEDATAYALNPPAPPVGTASLSFWRFANNTFTRIASTPNAVTSGIHSATISAGEPAVPGTEYFVGVDLNSFQYAAYVGFTTPVLQSGLADLSVQPIVLSPNHGQTLVNGTITNASFTASPPSSYTLKLGNATSTRSIPSLAPFGQLVYAIPWDPGAASDVVSVDANPTALIAELSRENNFRSATLSTFNPTAPSVTIALADANMTFEGTANPTSGGNVWGRYIAGIAGQTSTIRVAGSDVDNNLYEIRATLRTGEGANNRFAINGASIFSSPTSSSTFNIPFDFGTLDATPNLLDFLAIDQFGLRTRHSQRIHVEALPDFMTGGIPEPGETGAGGVVTFNRANRTFKLDFQNSIISLNPTLSELLAFDVPFIGDKTAEMLVAIKGTGVGTLNPALPIAMGLTGELKLAMIEKTLYEKKVPAGFSSSGLTFSGQLVLDGQTLDPTATQSVIIQAKGLKIVDVKTPLIKLFSLGAPGIAELKAGIKFGFNAQIDAAMKIGGVTAPSGFNYGLMSPSFIRPSITGTATVSGEAEILGFDVAELSGSVGLTIAVTFGLDNVIPGKVFAVEDFIDDPSSFGLSVDAFLNFNVKAEVFGFDVYEYKESFPLGNLVNTIDHGIFLTDPPSFASGKFLPPPSSEGRRRAAGDALPVIKNGNSLVGPHAIDPRPQIVINNAVLNGRAHSVQVVNVGTAAAPVGNLAVSLRDGGTWSPLATLPLANDVSSPELAMTNDGANGAAVVVYAVDKVAGSPATRTLNQKLTNQEIRYRYFNGTSWGGDLVLTSDGLLDHQPTVAFNAAGAGVLAFVTNGSAAPIDGSGNFAGSSNDIRASVWNATTHTWGAPISITSGNGSDSLPTTFVDANGQRYIAWVNTSPAGVSQIMYSTNTGGAWSAPLVLPIAGLAPGGTFRGLSLGSDGAGRLNVVFTYFVKEADGSVSSTLYQRPATVAGFGSTQPAVQLAANATFSGLETTPTPTGGMLVYWQQSDGQSNGIVGLTISQGVATAVTELSSSGNIERAPAAAVDGDGTIELLFNDAAVFGGTLVGGQANDGGSPAANGVVSSAIDFLPQPAFAADLSFAESATSAPTGSTIVGTAIITNTGSATSSITITAFSGVPGAGGVVVGQQVVTLAPGATFDFSQNFLVAAGVRDYFVVLTTPGAQALGTTQVQSTARLTGLADIKAVSVVSVTPLPGPGSLITIRATLRNESPAASPSFALSLFSGDPRAPQLPSSLLGTQTIAAMSGGEVRTIDFQVTLPTSAGDHLYTVAVDPSDVIPESDESNNHAGFAIAFRADPAVRTAGGSPGITATLLNSGTSNNVQIDVTLTNLSVGLSSVPLTNVPVNLRVSRNGGAFEDLGQRIISSLLVGSSATASFIVTARAGDNVFVASLDPSVLAADNNLENNSATANLSLGGIAALSAAGTLSVPVVVAGAPLTLNATVTNGGLVDAPGVPYAVYAALTSGGPSVLIGGGSIDVDGLASANVAIALNSGILARGVYTITLVIDPDETIVEDSRAGNVLTLSQIVATPLVLDPAASYVRRNGQSIDVWNGDAPTGSPDATYLLSTVSTLTAASSAAGQRVTIDFSSGNPLPSTFSFAALPAGPNRLTIVGTTGVDTFGMAGNTVSFVSGPTSAGLLRANVHELVFVGNGGNDPISLNYASGNPLPATMKLAGQFTMSGLQDFANTSFDLFQSTLLIAYAPGNSPAAAVRQALKRGFNGGLWNGTASGAIGAFNSSAAPIGSSRAIGYADSADGRGVNNTPNTILLKFTQRADADLNGIVEFSDLLALAQNYGQSSAVWDQGDFNFDDAVTFDDLLILAQEYGRSVAALVPATGTGSAAVRRPPAAVRRSPFADLVSDPGPWSPKRRNDLEAAAESVLGGAGWLRRARR